MCETMYDTYVTRWLSYTLSQKKLNSFRPVFLKKVEFEIPLISEIPWTPDSTEKLNKITTVF